ncbi:White collar 1 protein [Yarrowia sp. C11]|nr:White collar 1 protein [Yarrowia sp. E02]KAG5369891.1 White collar 1 protein [Yarrowia sp. C11]
MSADSQPVQEINRDEDPANGDDLSNMRSLYQTINEDKQVMESSGQGKDNIQHSLNILRAAQNHLKETGSVKGVYSSSGFDIVSLLYQVINRKNPQVDIGPVDLSCSFLVTDVSTDDNHIVYMSGAFEQLTGYPEKYILNQNCRFLQNPQGEARPAEAGFTDAASVFALRKAITLGNEVQVPLLNYKRGGESFVNMVTCIPLYLDKADKDRVTHFIGFQMDLNQYPDAILQRMLNGSYTMNYRLSSIPRQPRVIKPASPGSSVDIMSTITSTDPLSTEELVQRFLYHTSADTIMTVSLKGQIVQVSPAIYAQLEYTPEEVVGLSLADFIHPSDVTVVLRELREVSTTKTLSTLFRIRTKRSGYIWIDARGKINGGFKRMTHCVVLTLRHRTVTGLPLKVVLDSFEKNVIDTKPNSESLDVDPSPSSSEGTTAMGNFKRKKFSVLPKESIMPMDLWLRVSHNGLVLYTARTAKYLYGYNDMSHQRLQTFLEDGDAWDELMEVVGSTRRITTAFVRVKNASGFSVISRAIIYPGETFGGKLVDASVQLTPLSETSVPLIEKMALQKFGNISYKLGPCQDAFSLHQDSIVGKRQNSAEPEQTRTRGPSSVASGSTTSSAAAAAHVPSPPSASSQASNAAAQMITPQGSSVGRSTASASSGSASSADSDSFFKTTDANLLSMIGPSQVNGWQFGHNQLQVNNKKLAEQLLSRVAVK